jgi:hypothetical protein
VVLRRAVGRRSTRRRPGGAVVCGLSELVRPLAIAGVAIYLTLAPLAAAAQAPSSGDPQADAPKTEPAPTDAPRGEAAPAETDAAAEPEDPTKRDLQVTGFQCEALSLGRLIKELPAESQVDAISFTDPPPVTYRLPDQRREALTECSLRASGLAVRVDPARKAIILVPRDTSSPQLPNPKIRISLKLAGEPPKTDP